MLTVFPDSWTVEAAQAVCAEGAASLLEKSFGHSFDAHSGRRHALYQSVRGFALRHTSDEEAADAARSFVEYYRAHIEGLAGKLHGPQQSTALDALHDERANIAALLQIADGGNALWGAPFALALYRYWLTRGSYAEAQQWMERFALHAQDDSVRARCHAAAAVLATLLGDVTHAESLLQLETGAANLDEQAMAELHHAAGVVAHERGDVERAREAFSASLDCARRAHDDVKTARALDNLGAEYTSLRRFDEARGVLGESLDIYRALGGAESIAWVLYHLAGVAFEEERYEEALAMVTESYDIRRTLGHVYGIALSHYAMAQAKFALERFDEAKSDFIEALRLWEREKQRSWIALVLDALAALAVREHAYERAGLLSESAARLREELVVEMRPHDRRTHDEYVAAALQENAPAFNAGRLKAKALSTAGCVEVALGT